MLKIERDKKEWERIREKEEFKRMIKTDKDEMEWERKRMLKIAGERNGQLFETNE